MRNPFGEHRSFVTLDFGSFGERKIIKKMRSLHVLLKLLALDELR